MMPRYHSFLMSLVFLGISFLATAASAQDSERAKNVFDEALHEMSEGNYERACPAFAESLRLDPLPGTAFTLAVCESRWGHVATAQNRYRDFLTMVEALPPKDQKRQSERMQVAREQIEKLDAAIPTLTLKLGPDAPANTVVKRNEQVLSGTDLGMPTRLDPGIYTITTEAPGLPPQKTQIIVERGEKKTVLLDVTGSGPRERPIMSGRKTAGFVIGGFGLAGLVTGAITTAMAFDQKAVLDEHCGAKIGETNPKLCDVTGANAAQSIGRLNLASTISFAAGGLGLGMGIILVATAPKRAAVSPAVGGQNIAVGVFEAGPSSVLVGAQGLW